MIRARPAVVAMLSALLVLGPVGPPATAAGTPGQNFDLRAFKLQLPISSGSGVVEIRQPQLATYSSAYFFTRADGAMTFWCPVTGGTTSGSSYPRSELRDNREWSLGGTHRQSGSLKVLQQPSTGRLIFAQVKGRASGSEMLKLRWADGSVLVGTKASVGATEVKRTLLTGLPLGTTITYVIEIVGFRAQVSVNGKVLVHNLDSTWAPDTYYFKAGAYTEDYAGPATEGGRTAFYQFNPGG